MLGWVGGPGRLGVAFEDIVDADHRRDPARLRAARRMGGVPQRLLAPDPAGSRARLFLLAYISRMTRSFMLEQLRQEYVITARAKGLSERRVIWRHALRNIDGAADHGDRAVLCRLLEGSVLTETVFAWPGIGRYITNSLLNADMNAVLGGTLVVGAVFIGLNLLSDMLYRLLDPRAR
jgi:peptide/nickel transport system permease protein